jgi:hypothetical protein
LQGDRADRSSPVAHCQACIGVASLDARPAIVGETRALKPSPAERATDGKAARRAAPRSRHGKWEPAEDRRDPIELLEQQARTRVPELSPIRYGRMLISPFTFFRGATYVMAADLADEPRSGLQTQLCGDAHLSNFGTFAGPDRQLVFGPTTSTRHSRGRLSGTSSASSRASRWPRATEASARSSASRLT